MANTTEYRICPDSGLQFHKPAETLMKANAVAAVVFLLIGGILALLVPLTRTPGRSGVMMTSYVPMPAEPVFYLCLILFAVGALIGCFVFFGTLVVAKAERTYEGSIPLVTFGALNAALLELFT